MRVRAICQASIRLSEIRESDHSPFLDGSTCIQAARNYRKRRLFRNAPSHCECFVKLHSRGNHTLHKTNSQRLVTVEFIGGQQVQHCVAPPGTLNHSNRRATGRHDPSTNLKLRKPAVVGCNDDIRSKHQLNSNGEAYPFDCRYHRLGPSSITWQTQVMRFNQANVLRNRPLPPLSVLRDQRQIHTRGEVVPNGIEHAHSEILVFFQSRVGFREL